MADLFGAAFFFPRPCRSGADFAPRHENDRPALLILRDVGAEDKWPVYFNRRDAPSGLIFFSLFLKEIGPENLGLSLGYTTRREIAYSKFYKVPL